MGRHRPIGRQILSLETTAVGPVNCRDTFELRD
jgi:hypothetical protein